VPGYTIEFVSPEWDRFDEVLELSFAVLYEPFGVAWPEEASAAADWMHPAPGTHVAVAISSEHVLLGSARLLPAAGDRERQVRQVAVSPDARWLGVGSALMLALERKAAEEGAQETWLNSRNTAYGFYEVLGYRLEGDEFVSHVTGIPHRAARKRLG
jgi:GNAT superfamily N-acetyltransferase